jgi:hypothetical protein
MSTEGVQVVYGANGKPLVLLPHTPSISHRGDPALVQRLLTGDIEFTPTGSVSRDDQVLDFAWARRFLSIFRILRRMAMVAAYAESIPKYDRLPAPRFFPLPRGVSEA